ncbi:uncharacterized protein LOC130649624 [Hydractinia symbiolongicarpus]|uniref:uncharacterized protein LOC130649624 n=1 Tax=Hydractinia symbiolongicarpus TaxID=13093 RepID=UPI00254F5C77|nr:uncharacterized protein LOC130649624 [Hydractinia symbiolongicarpus]
MRCEKAGLRKSIAEQSILEKLITNSRQNLNELKKEKCKGNKILYQTKHAADVDRCGSVIQTLEINCQEWKKKVGESDRLEDGTFTTQVRYLEADDERSKNEFEIQELKFLNEERIGVMMRMKEEKIRRLTTYVENFRMQRIAREVRRQNTNGENFIQTKDVDAQVGNRWKSKYDDLVKERNNMHKDLI